MIVGPRRAEHLQPALEALELKLTPAEHAEIHALFVAHTGVPDGDSHTQRRRRPQRLPLAACIEAMEQTLRHSPAASSTSRCARSFDRPSRRAFMGLMPAYRAGDTPAYGLKAVAIFPENPRHGIDAHQGVVMVFGGDDGRVTGVVDASAVTAIRTAAVTAVATRALARAGATTSRSSARACRRARTSRRWPA